MTNFTIEQLEALKQATTPGPWEWRVGERVAYRHELIGADGTPILACGALRWPDEPEENLIAAAPALVDALIAEKQAHAKLLRKLDEMLSWWGKSSEKLSARGMEELAEVSRSRTAQLTRILEADNA